MTAKDAETLKERIVEILYSELYADDYGDIDGRHKSAERIVSEIIVPILSGNQPT